MNEQSYQAILTELGNELERLKQRQVKTEEYVMRLEKKLDRDIKDRWQYLSDLRESVRK